MEDTFGGSVVDGGDQVQWAEDKKIWRVRRGWWHATVRFFLAAGLYSSRIRQESTKTNFMQRRCAPIVGGS